MGSRTWFKVYAEDWLDGDIREETSSVRGTLADLNALCAIGPYSDIGEIKFAPEIGYTDSQIAKRLNITQEQWQKDKKSLENQKEIATDGNDVIILLKWDRYQGEYERTKKYKKGTEKGTKKSTEKNTGKGTEKYHKENRIEKNRIDKIRINNILAYVGKLKGTHFSDEEDIKARVKEGAKEEDLKLVAQYKWQEIQQEQDPEKKARHLKYFKPSTLFRRTNFRRYLDEARAAKITAVMRECSWCRKEYQPSELTSDEYTVNDVQHKRLLCAACVKKRDANE